MCHFRQQMIRSAPYLPKLPDLLPTLFTVKGVQVYVEGVKVYTTIRYVTKAPSVDTQPMVRHSNAMTLSGDRKHTYEPGERIDES